LMNALAKTHPPFTSAMLTASGVVARIKQG
jgi:hypothetical protein